MYATASERKRALLRDGRGQKDAASDTARKMKVDGLNAEVISKYTGLSIEEIEKI